MSPFQKGTTPTKLFENSELGSKNTTPHNFLILAVPVSTHMPLFWGFFVALLPRSLPFLCMYVGFVAYFRHPFHPGLLFFYCPCSTVLGSSDCLRSPSCPKLTASNSHVLSSLSTRRSSCGPCFLQKYNLFSFASPLVRWRTGRGDPSRTLSPNGNGEAFAICFSFTVRLIIHIIICIFRVGGQASSKGPSRSSRVQASIPIRPSSMNLCALKKAPWR